MPWVWVWCLKLTLPLLSTSATGYCRESASSSTQTEHWVLQGVCLILNTDWTLGTAGSLPHPQHRLNTGYSRESASSSTQTEHWVLQGVCLILNTDWTLPTFVCMSQSFFFYLSRVGLRQSVASPSVTAALARHTLRTCGISEYLRVTATECLRVIKHKTAVLHLTDHEQYSTDDILSWPLNLDERQLTSSFDLKKRGIFS